MLDNVSKEVVNSLVRHGKNVQLWQPKEGEWCWFWNSALGIWFISTLKDFGEYNNSIQYRCNSVYYICEKCEPFIGELPSSLKDK